MHMPTNDANRRKAAKQHRMSHIMINEETGELRSSLACHVCRKRKIKCGRELPVCKICEQSEQQCSYPNRASRPGPKIGSTQSGRKRPSENQHNERRRSQRDCTSPPAASEDDETTEKPNGHAAVVSPGHSVDSNNSGKHSQHMQSLSFIIHPSHEHCSPEEEYDTVMELPDEVQGNTESLVTSTCYALGLSPEVLDNLIDTFFQSFTAYRLFLEPEFRSKLRRMESGAQINALLAAMFAFSAKEYAKVDEARIDVHQSESLAATSKKWSSSHFIDLAMEHSDKALRDCGDEAPPLCLLQAFILTAHWLLIQGVRGRAWRYLGTCVRIAYELNLHLVDASQSADSLNPNVNQWCEDEERRRAWWAIWEMDVFASVIRRCPTAIDWSQNETFLPAEDDNWFRKEPQKSCMLATGLIDRYKYLQASGNQSPKAWFIVVNSLMKEAQTISSPVGINRPTTCWKFNSCQDNQNQITYIGSGREKEASNRLSTVYNTLRCFSMALPASLRYREQYLTFEASDSRQPGISSPRHLHSSIYSIHLMTQLTKIMIYKYRVFHASTMMPPPSQWEKDSDASQNPLDSLLSVHCENEALGQYFKAADDILTTVHSSSDIHFRYVNPFLANTIWLAAAVQLLHKNMLSESSEEDLVNSKFEVLCMTYDHFVEYWEMSATPRQNLATLQTHLKSFGNLSNEDESHNESPNARIKLPDPRTFGGRSVVGRKQNQENIEGSISTTSTFQPQAKPQEADYILSSQKDSSSSDKPLSSRWNNHQSVQPTSAYLTPATSASGSYPGSRQLPFSPLQANSFDQGSTDPLALGLQAGTISQGSSNTNLFPALGKTSSYLTAPRMDPGFLDSFNFMHNLGAASNMEFSSYLDEVYPGTDTG